LSDKRAKKYSYWERLWGLLEDYRQILIVDCNNVSSKQIQDIRLKLRPLDAVVVMGKNTLIKAGLALRMKEPTQDEATYSKRKENWAAYPQLERLSLLLKKNVGMVLCKGRLTEVKNVIFNSKRGAPARPNTIAPDEVWIRAGPTGLDPKQTDFFQALQIQTKIVKTQIEIVADKKIIEKGKKVGNSEVVLLEKLKIRPFSYRMEIVTVYDNGSVYSPAVLDINESEIKQKVQNAIRNVAALSLQIGYPTAASAPHSIINAFKNLVSLTLDGDFHFSQGEKLKEAIKNPQAHAHVAHAHVAAEKPKVEEKKEEKKEEEEVDMGGLFGNDDY